MATHDIQSNSNNMYYDEINALPENVSEDWEVIAGNSNVFDDDDINRGFSGVFSTSEVIVIVPVDGILNSGTREALETLLERVYVDPLEVNPGFITEKRDFTIIVWNAYSEQVVTITDISIVNVTGTELDAPDLPKDIARSYDEVLTLSVLVEGPPTQDTQYTITVGGFEFEIDVQGIRAIPIELNPDWGEGIITEYSWLTAVATHPRYLKEQRRPMSSLPWRNVEATYMANGLAGVKFINHIQYGKDKVFIVPIYTEQLLCSVITTGLDYITPSVEYDKFYNLNNNCTHLLFSDGEGTTEIKEIDTIGASTISFKSTIAGTFNAGKTVIYPAVFSVIANVSGRPENSTLSMIKVGFQEFKKNG